jgi:hypothetical protein
VSEVTGRDGCVCFVYCVRVDRTGRVHTRVALCHKPSVRGCGAQDMQLSRLGHAWGGGSGGASRAAAPLQRVYRRLKHVRGVCFAVIVGLILYTFCDACK